MEKKKKKEEEKNGREKNVLLNWAPRNSLSRDSVTALSALGMGRGSTR